MVALLLLLSCAQKRLVPVGNGVRVDPKTSSAFYEDEFVRMTVRVNAWDGYPASLPERLLPVYLEVENKGDRTVELKREWIAVIDDLGNQYNALDPKNAVEAVRGGSRVGVAVGLGFGTPYYGLGFLAGPPYDTDMEEVINRAFIPGKLLPGARLKGFLYFQKLHDKANRVKLRIGYKIAGKLRTVEFRFRVEDGKGSDSDRSEKDREGDI